MPPNLVPTIESTALPSTPVGEWAASTTRVLHARAQQVATPEERPIPGAFPDELKPDPASASGGGTTAGGHWETEEGRGQDAGGETLLEAARARLPAEDDVQRAITSAGQAAKAILPEAIQAYLPSAAPSTSPTSATNSSHPTAESYTPPRAPFLRDEDHASSVHSNLSTEAQAGSLLPPSPASAVVNTDADASVFSEIRSSSPMSEGYTPLAGTPAAVSPHTPSNGVGAAGSRFMEVDLGLLHTTSPQPLSTSSNSTSTSASGAPDASTDTSSASVVHEGMRAPHNTVEEDDVPHTPETLVGPGVPAAAPPPAPVGVIAPAEDLDTPVNERRAAREETGHAQEGAEGERKRDRLVRRVKEKLHVGGHGQAEST